MIKIPKILIIFLKKIKLYVFLKHIYYKNLKFLKLIKNNTENNLFSIFLNMNDDFQFIDIGVFKGSKIDGLRDSQIGGRNMHPKTDQRRSIRNKKVTQEPNPNK